MTPVSAVESMESSATSNMKKKGELCASCWNATQELVVKWLKLDEKGARVYVCGHEDVATRRVGYQAGLVNSAGVSCPSSNTKLTDEEELKYRAAYKRAHRAGLVQAAFENARLDM